MVKTAEEILREKRINFTSALQVQLVHDAMREFAAQEVEEYRLKIRSDVFDMYLATGDLEGMEIVGHAQAIDRILKLIDKVK